MVYVVKVHHRVRTFVCYAYMCFVDYYSHGGIKKMFEYVVMGTVAVATSLATGMYYYFKSGAGSGLHDDENDDKWLYASYTDAIEHQSNSGQTAASTTGEY
jgi:hypothetical protein